MSTTEDPKHIPSVPYGDPPSRLQTVDLWLSRPLNESDPEKSLWIIYIHGGAWRDPLQTSLCAEPTVKQLLSSPQPNIAGIASLNYRLSPYLHHPTDPSSASDAHRNVEHPTHIRDVARGIAFLQKEYGVKRWIGVGHSCGATLLCHYVSGIGLEDVDTRTKAIGPECLVLGAGIYNIPLFLRNHAVPAVPETIERIYQDIIRGAFGPRETLGTSEKMDTNSYVSVSPVSGKYNTTKWPEGKLIMLAHSYEDELVERAQRDVMCVALDREGWSIVMEDGDEEAQGSRVLEVRDIKGPHDFGWKDGEQSARLIGEVIARLTQ